MIARRALSIAAACMVLATAGSAHAFAGLWLREGAVRPTAPAMHVVLESSGPEWRVIVWHAYQGDGGRVSLLVPVPADADLQQARLLSADRLAGFDAALGPTATRQGCDGPMPAVPSISLEGARAVQIERFARLSEIAGIPSGAAEIDANDRTPRIAWWRVAMDPSTWPRRADGSMIPDAITFTFHVEGGDADVLVPLRAALFDTAPREVTVDVLATRPVSWTNARVAPLPSPVLVDPVVRLGFPAFYAGFVDTVFAALPGATVIAEYSSPRASRFRTRIDVHAMQGDAMLRVGGAAHETTRLAFESAREGDAGTGCEAFGLPIEGTTSSPRHRYDIARVVLSPLPGVIHAASPLVAGVVRAAEREIIRERQAQRPAARSCGCDVRTVDRSLTWTWWTMLALCSSLARFRRRSAMMQNAGSDR